MKENVQVKVCGLTRAGDVAAAREFGAAYAGFIAFPKSPRFIAAEHAHKLFAEAPEGGCVYVNVSPSTEELEAARETGFDFFQLHFDLGVSLATVAAWAGIVGPQRLWLAPRIPPGEDFPQMALEFADTLLLDAYSPDKYGGTGKVCDWNTFRDLRDQYAHKHWVLSGGLRPENVAEALQVTGATAVDVSSGVEEAPGIKSAAKMKAFFEAVHAA